MLRFSAAALVAFLLGTPFVGTRSAVAEECFPACDYTHYYGPSAFTYVRPGLYGYPRCGPRGECSPHLVYSTTGYPTGYPGRITIRFPRARAPQR
jgi:hypothetical protein